MEIKQFEDKNMAHFSYAIVNQGEMALIDPSRDPQPYYKYASETNSKITTVIETHPHADFVSSHLEIHLATGATIYASKLLGAEYPHQTFDDGDAIVLGNSTLKAINTPGHSPDSISILAMDENGKQEAVFTGDTLFIGDCGRPDLREQAGALTATRVELAKQMYHSLREKIIMLDDDALVFPAHGAGSLCGKNLSMDVSSTIGKEKKNNWSLQKATEEEFVETLNADQPFIPKYFTFNVGLNKKGADNYADSISKVEKREPVSCNGCAKSLNKEFVIIDTRSAEQFNKSHLKNSINLMNDTKFETWLGSILNWDEKFYLSAENEATLNELIGRIAKIGYEKNIRGAFVQLYGDVHENVFNAEELIKNEGAFTIVDIRNPSEVAGQKIFSNSVNIPLYELRERAKEILLHKPIVIHCAGGYRSAAGKSIVNAIVGEAQTVSDLSVSVKDFYQ